MSRYTFTSTVNCRYYFSVSVSGPESTVITVSVFIGHFVVIFDFVCPIIFSFGYVSFFEQKTTNAKKYFGSFFLIEKELKTLEKWAH